MTTGTEASEGFFKVGEKDNEDMPEHKLWLWRNFVDGCPEYWAFDNPFPCYLNGDPMTLGEPCGYAIIKQSINGRLDVNHDEVIRDIKKALEKEKQ